MLGAEYIIFIGHMWAVTMMPRWRSTDRNVQLVYHGLLAGGWALRITYFGEVRHSNALCLSRLYLGYTLCDYYYMRRVYVVVYASSDTNRCHYSICVVYILCVNYFVRRDLQILCA